MNRNLLIAFAMSVVAIALSSGELQAQAVECSVDDLQCLNEERRQACGQPASLAESCVAWLSRVERLDLTQHPETQLLVAYGYMLASGIASSEADAARYRERSRIVYQEILALWPAGHFAYRAYRGLANLTDNMNDSILLHRTALRAEPGEGAAFAALARALEGRGEIADRREAAELYLDAFDANGRPFSWYFLYRAIQLYESIGLMDQASAVRDKVERDSEVQRMSEDISSGRILRNMSLAGEVLQVACDAYYVAISDSETCANAVDALAAEASRSSFALEERQALVEVATEGIRLLRIAEEGAVTGEEASQREQLYKEYLQVWIDNGTAAGSTYMRLANLPSSDSDERLAAMEKAVELAPSNGQFHYWLALEYIEQGKPDDALEHLQVAKSAAEEIPGVSRDMVDTQIRRAESLRLEK